jgi:hypothetical protein
MSAFLKTQIKAEPALTRGSFLYELNALHTFGLTQ